MNRTEEVGSIDELAIEMEDIPVTTATTPPSSSSSSSSSSSPSSNGISRNGPPSDIISTTIRKGTQGIGLWAILTVTSVIGLVTILQVLEYLYDPNKSAPSNASLGAGCSADEAAASSLAVWQDLLFTQMGLIQNLIHASLVGAATIVAAYRGDPVWLYFARNIGFFLGLTASSYLTVSIFNNAATWSSTTTLQLKPLVRLVVESTMTLAAVVAFAKLEYVRRQVIGLQRKYYQSARSFANSLTLEVDSERFPPQLAQTRGQYQRCELIYKMARGVQAMAVAYTVRTTYIVLASPCDGVGGSNVVIDGTLETFVGSYTSGGHQAALLAFLFQAATFPRCSACQGGAILTAGWRLWVALAYLPRVIPLAFDDDNDNNKTTTRALWPLIFTAAEIVMMGFTVLAAVWQYRENRATQTSTTSSTTRTRSVPGNQGAYKQVLALEDDSDDDDDMIDRKDFDTRIVDVDSKEPSCWTMRHIAFSPVYSSSQQRGAHLMWVGSMLLFFEMTLECLLLLPYGSLATMYTNDVYKWGMHVCAMYLFCCVMVVSCQEVYGRARILLFLACPAGSFIGLWQLWVLWTQADEIWDTMSMGAAALFGTRAVCGILQTLGLILLKDIVPRSREEEEGNSEEDGTATESIELETLMSKGRNTLMHTYIPAVAAYVAQVAYMGTCNYPLVSVNTQNGCGSDSVFSLEPTWPGFGVFWHYGFLLVVFAGDGLSTNYYYRPSLVIALLFAAHVCLLISCSVVLNLKNMITTKPTLIELFEPISVSMLMIASGTLAWRLHAVTRVKQ